MTRQRLHRLAIAMVATIAWLGASANIPAGYYSTLDGKSGQALKDAIHNLAKQHTMLSYSSLWIYFAETDCQAEDESKVWDMYSDKTYYFRGGSSGVYGMHKEHSLPKSWWGGDVNDAYKDLYHLNPSDQRANSQKSNYPPGHVVKGDKFDNGSFRMDSKAKSQYGFICFEPSEKYRGDFARAYFYIATAYEDFTWKSGTSPFDAALAMDNDSYLEFKPWLIEVLLDWHRADPVSDKEICRADQISNIQHNRNPFIDYPELVEYIWGNKKGEAVDLASLTCTAGTGICPEPIIPTPEPQLYDTLINLPAIPKNAAGTYVNGNIKGAETAVQSNGTSSITMGNGTNNGEISFTGIELADTAVLAFRASPYNTATSMQLDVYANETLLRSIQVKVEDETRNEIRYRITVPQETNSIRIVSVGGSTSKRACMQELYLLSPKKDTTPIATPEVEKETATKVLRDGQLVIIRNNEMFTLQGQRIQ